MPPGARGLMLAVMLAALMSSLTSIFNSSSTIFAMDVWTMVRRKASEMEIMIVGRIFVVVLVAISIVWIPVIKASQGSDLFVYIQVVSSFTQPPICAVFLLAIFWARLNEKGAFWALMMGLVVGMLRFIVEYSYTAPQCGDDFPDPRPGIIRNFHYLYFSIFLFVLTGGTAIAISLLTKPIDPNCLHRLTYQSRHSKEKRFEIDEMPSDSTDSSDGTGELPLKANGPQHAEGEELVISLETNMADNLKDRVELDDLLSNEKPDSRSPDPELSVQVKDGTEEGIPPGGVPCWRRVVNWICGIENRAQSEELSHKKVTRYEMRSIAENPVARQVSNAFAVLLMAIGMFFYGYFA